MSQIRDSQPRSSLARFINPFIAIANPYVYTKLYIESGSHYFKAVEMLQIIWDFPVLNLINNTHISTKWRFNKNNPIENFCQENSTIRNGLES